MVVRKKTVRSTTEKSSVTKKSSATKKAAVVPKSVTPKKTSSYWGSDNRTSWDSYHFYEYSNSLPELKKSIYKHFEKYWRSEYRIYVDTDKDRIKNETARLVFINVYDWDDFSSRYVKVLKKSKGSKYVVLGKLAPSGRVVPMNTHIPVKGYILKTHGKTDGPYNTLAEAKKAAKDWSGDSEWDYEYSVDYVPVYIIKNDRTIGMVYASKYTPASKMSSDY